MLLVTSIVLRLRHKTQPTAAAPHKQNGYLRTSWGDSIKKIKYQKSKSKNTDKKSKMKERGLQ
jgi:hypothetical protein